MTLGPLHLMRPEWLWALLPAALFAFWLLRARRRSGSWSTVISPALLPHLLGEQVSARRRNYLPWILGGWLLAVVAMTGPSLHKIPQPVHQREDALAIVLDLSYSMKATDLAPSRLDRARQKILDLLARRDEGQTGLVAFAGDAHVVAPLTDDNPTIANLMPALNPDMMPLPGSDAAGAIDLALELLRSGGGSGGRILLLTDAVADSQQQAIARAVGDAGVELVIMGVGTRNGAPLPLPDGGFVKDTNGSIVMPSLDESRLAQLARRAGGRYLSMRTDASDVEALAKPMALPGAERLSSQERRADQWEDQGYLLLLPLLALAALLFRRGVLVGLLLSCFLATAPQPASAQSWDDLWLNRDQQGLEALRGGDAERASQLFEDPAWAGTAAYQSGDYEAATRRFGEGDSADDWYNRGNALARSGDLEGAIEAYRESLARQPDQADARENLELVEQLKEQQEQQQQQDQQQNEQQGQDNEQQNQDGNNQQSPGQDPPQSEQDSGENRQQQDTSPNQQSSPEQPGDEDSGQNPQQDADAENEQQEQPGSQQEPSESPREAAPQSAEQDTAQAERDQAMEQWLRRVPDDPSGLLREKFRYESRQRLQQGDKPENETYW